MLYVMIALNEKGQEAVQMADEVIKLIEYFAGSGIVQGAFIAYLIFGAVVLFFVIAVFVVTFRAILTNRRNWR